MRVVRLSTIAAALAVVVLSCVALPSAAGASATPTKRIVLRPVTASGHVSAAYHQMAFHHGGGVDCTQPEVSPVSVDPGVYFCAPSAAYAVACWRAAAAGHVLCYRNPFGREVDNLYGQAPRHATFPREATAPFGIVLGNGLKCTIRDGGAWGPPAAHPSWIGYYACGAQAVYASASRAATNGIDESHSQWKVYVGSESGPLTLRKIVKAYFVGNAA